MAILNIKNFPDELYAVIKQRSKAERRSVAQEVIYLLEQAQSQPRPTSILELRGLGKSVWSGIDTDAFIDRERSEWD